MQIETFTPEPGAAKLTCITIGETHVTLSDDDPRASLGVGASLVEVSTTELAELATVARVAANIAHEPSGGAILFNLLLGKMEMSPAKALAWVESPDKLLALLAGAESEVERHQSAPPPATIPVPADFNPRPLIGQIAGQPVYGDQGWETVGGGVRRYAVEVELAGVLVSCNGEALGFNGLVNSLCEIRLEAFGTLLELHQAGYIDPLVRLARQWLAEPAQAAQRKAA